MSASGDPRHKPSVLGFRVSKAVKSSVSTWLTRDYGVWEVWVCGLEPKVYLQDQGTDANRSGDLVFSTGAPSIRC